MKNILYNSFVIMMRRVFLFSRDLSYLSTLEKLHKQQVLGCFEDICIDAKLKRPFLVARQLCLIGEGLIVTYQVNGPSEEVLDSAREMVSILTGREFEK